MLDSISHVIRLQTIRSHAISFRVRLRFALSCDSLEHEIRSRMQFGLACDFVSHAILHQKFHHPHVRILCTRCTFRFLHIEARCAVQHAPLTKPDSDSHAFSCTVRSQMISTCVCHVPVRSLKTIAKHRTYLTSVSEPAHRLQIAVLRPSQLSQKAQHENRMLHDPACAQNSS